MNMHLNKSVQVSAACSSFYLHKYKARRTVDYSVGAWVLYASSGTSYTLCCWNLMVQLLVIPSPEKVAWVEKASVNHKPCFITSRHRPFFFVRELYQHTCPSMDHRYFGQIICKKKNNRANLSPSILIAPCFKISDF